MLVCGWFGAKKYLFCVHRDDLCGVSQYHRGSDGKNHKIRDFSRIHLHYYNNPK